jgi:regulator of protease activity HflC (stomatin/prohibitin superfamily)
MNKGLIFLARLLAFHFVPENYKAAVTRFGMYHRARGPGFIWVAPFIERVENLVKIGMRFATFPVKQVLSSDGVLLDFELTVFYRFDPDSTSRPIAAQLARLPDHVLESIVREYAEKSLRQAVAQYSAEDICASGTQAIAEAAGRQAVAQYSAEDIHPEGPIGAIEQGVIEGLKARVKHLGLDPMARGGVMIKEITPPKDFVETILTAKGHKIILKVLADYQAADVDQVLLAELVRSFKDAPPRFFSSLSELLRFSRTERSDEE